MILLPIALTWLAALPLYAQPSDPNFAHPHQVVTVALQGYSIAGLVTHLQYPGIMKLSEANGQPQFELRGNFLVRSRRHWLDEETLGVVVDAPSDQWASFDQTFRARTRYGADVRALLEELGRRYAVSDWTFVGTSEGSVSAFHAARMNPGLARRVILTSSVFIATRNGPGLSGADWKQLSAPLLWVHHEDDPCQYTSYHDARRFAQRTASPLVMVRGGDPGHGGACQAFTAHGFVGVERETVLAMRSWVKDGKVPSDVGPAK